MTPYQRHQGFSLIELMIVVAIVAILSAIAISSYSKYIQSSRRSDAYAGLSQAQGVLERCYATAYDYSQVETGTEGCSTLSATSPEGYYTITFTPEGAAAPFSSYQLTATPAPGSPQAQDTTCATFTITNANVKTATSSSGASTTLTCWQP
jgi:type IV pilus assembly protein PilE